MKRFLIMCSIAALLVGCQNNPYISSHEGSPIGYDISVNGSGVTHIPTIYGYKVSECDVNPSDVLDSVGAVISVFGGSSSIGGANIYGLCR